MTLPLNSEPDHENMNTKTEFLAMRDAELSKAREYKMRAARLRKTLSAKHGNAGGINPFPVSGGICNHWPREDANKIVALVHSKQDAVDRALGFHKQAGKRAFTFRRLIAETHHLA